MPLTAAPSAGLPPRHDPLAPLPWVPDVRRLVPALQRDAARCWREGGGVLLLWVWMAETGPGVADPVQAARLRRALGGRLRQRLRGADLLHEVGDDAWAALVLGADASTESAVCQRLQQALAGPVLLGEHRHAPRLHLGALTQGALVSDLGGLIQTARARCHRAAGVTVPA